MANITDLFVELIYSLRKKVFTDNQIESVRKCILDYCAAIIGGSVISHEKINDLLKVVNEGGGYSIVGHNKKVCLLTALLANGLESHVAELDDGVISGIIHPGAPILTALLTFSQHKNINWDDFVLGVIAGYECACRLADSIQPSHKKLGFHASATCGTVGVACGLAMMLALSKEELKEAITVALASSHGTLKVLEDASELKPYNIASAALNGTVAVFMAKAGFKGADDALTGEAGFLSQMSQKPDLLKLTNKNEKLYIEQVYFKPYASCRYTHPAIEAGIKMRSIYDFDIDSIKEIEVLTYELAVHHHDHTYIPNISSAKMSIPYGAAIGLVFKSGAITSFTQDKIKNQKIQQLISKVKVGSSEVYTNSFPEKSMGEMTLRTINNQTFRVVVEYPKGEPSNPMSLIEMKEKLIESCRFAKMKEGKINEFLRSLEQKEINIKETFDLLYTDFNSHDR